MNDAAKRVFDVLSAADMLDGKNVAIGDAIEHIAEFVEINGDISESVFIDKMMTRIKDMMLQCCDRSVMVMYRDIVNSIT